MFVNVEKVVRAKRDEDRVTGFVFSFQGDVVYANEYAHGKGIAFCYLPRINGRVSNWGCDAGCAFGVNKIGPMRWLDDNGADSRGIERCWGIYAAGLREVSKLSVGDVAIFNEARDYLEGRIRKGLKTRVPKSSA